MLLPGLLLAVHSNKIIGCTCPPRPSPATTPYPTYVPTTESPTLSPIYSPSTVPSFSTSPSVSLQPSGQPSTCSNTITVSIWTDGSPGENYYNITDACTGEHVGGSDPSGFKPELAIRPNVFYEKKYCVESSRYVFSIYDTYGGKKSFRTILCRIGISRVFFLNCLTRHRWYVLWEQQAQFTGRKYKALGQRFFHCRVQRENGGGWWRLRL